MSKPRFTERARLILGAVVLAFAATNAPSAAAYAKPRLQHRVDRQLHWVGAWEGAPESGGPAGSDQSYRLLVHTSIGGQVLRLRFSNSYGTTPVTLSDVTVGLPANGVPGPAVDASTMRKVSFPSGSGLTIPAGQNAYSLPVRFSVPGDAWLTVSFYAPGSYGATTYHQVGMTTSYETLSGGGDAASDASGAGFTEPTISWTYLTGVDVVAPRRVSTVVALGDSITDCCIEVPDSNMRWPDLLEQRLAAVSGGQRFSVVNAGISGNDVSNDRGGNTTQGAAGDTRDVRDVFQEPNVSTMILFEGINDIGTDVQAPAIIASYRNILAAAHSRHIRVLIATLTPCEGSVAYGTDYTLNCGTRDLVNTWITQNSGLFDGLIDFAAVVANPADPDLWNPIYNVGDQLHPNQLGLLAMADAIPLQIFNSKPPATGASAGTKSRPRPTSRSRSARPKQKLKRSTRSGARHRRPRGSERSRQATRR